MQVLPLAVEDVLHELLQRDVFLQAALQRCDCRRLPFLDVLRPVHPALVVVFLLGCLKKRVIIEPVCLLAAEDFVVRLCCCIALESCMCLAQALVLEDARLLEVSRRIEVGIGDLGLLLAEPAPLDERIDVDEQRVARKRRRRLVRRIAVTARAERKDLPDVLARLSEEVDEAVSFFAEIADAVL